MSDEEYRFTSAIIGKTEPCNAVTLDQQYFLSLFDRLFPGDYLAPLKAYPNSGYELFQALAALGERIALAIKHLECGSLIIFAEDESYATVVVTFSRPTAVAGAVAIKAGTLVLAPNGGREFELLEDVVFGALDLTKDATVRAVASGYEWNVRGQRVAANGDVIVGEISEIALLYTDPPYGDTSFVVTQVSDAAGGVPPVLAGLGEDRGIVRGAGESADVYRVRARSLPDTISPGAIVRNTSYILDPYGLSFDFIETWQITYQTCWDAPSPNVGTPTYQATPPTNPQYDNTLFVYDDPRPEYPLRNVWFDELELRGAFIVVVELATLNDVGLAYDDPGMQPTDFRAPNTGYGRGTSAYDIVSSDDPAVVYPCCYDGWDTLYASIIFGLNELLQRIKAGGVAAIIERQRL